MTEHLGESLVSLDTYADGYKNGPSREWYEDGVLRSEGALRDGLPVGEFTEWHANGVLAARQVFAENGMTLLEDSTWDEHGRPIRTEAVEGEGMGRADRSIGESVRRIESDGPGIDMDRSLRLLYQGELFTGEVVEHLGGALVSLECYEDGLRHGPNQEWYKDGTPRSEGMSRRGFPNGVSREWHPNGALASERVFADDGLTMLSDREWDENGQPTRAWRREEG